MKPNEIINHHDVRGNGSANNCTNRKDRKVALIFGVCGDQGQAVATGLLASKSYDKIYGVTRDVGSRQRDSLSKQLGVAVDLGDLSNDTTSDDSTGNAVNENTDDNTEENTTGNKNNYGERITLITADLSDRSSLRQIFSQTRATNIFLVTATDIPTEDAEVGSFHECEEREYESIVGFFDVLRDVHLAEWGTDGADKLKRHVIFSTLDNVRGLVEWLELHCRKVVPESDDPDGDDPGNILKIKPLDDGGIVPHYSGKGHGGEYALTLLHGLPNPWSLPPSVESLADSNKPLLPPNHPPTEPTPPVHAGLAVTLLTLPFLHSNFAASAMPLPTASEGRTTQWSISANLGDVSHPIDMFSVSDLQYVVPTIFGHVQKYSGVNVRLSAERITMEEVAYQFSDLFGKDVIYSPLTFEEMSSMMGDEDAPSALALAQMCQYLVSDYAKMNIQETENILKLWNDGGGLVGERRPQKFEDWLLTHSDQQAFEKAGLSLDASPIHCVTVFNATSMQGKSVIKGLLSDTRKQYIIRACICTSSTGDGINNDVMAKPPSSKQQLEIEAKKIQSLDPKRVSVHYANLDDVHSCTEAVHGADGAFVVTDFFLFCTEPQYSPNNSSSQGTHYFLNPSSPPPIQSQNSFLSDTLMEKEEREERHARTVIDACSKSGTVRHLVLSTLESAEDVHNELKDIVDGNSSFSERSHTGDLHHYCDAGIISGASSVGSVNSHETYFDPKARMAAYARSKKISVTYVLMPVYSEKFFPLMADKIRKEREMEEGGSIGDTVLSMGRDVAMGSFDIVNAAANVAVVTSVGDSPETTLAAASSIEGVDKDDKVVCMSVDELGPAVANIFDSYEVYAGHEIGLMTDVLSLAEATDMIHQVFFGSGQNDANYHLSPVMAANPATAIIEEEEGEDGESSTVDEPPQSNNTTTPKSTSKYRVDTFAKDLGQMFRYYSNTEAVKKRHLVAKTLELVPDAKPFRRWLEENRDNVEFREMLGLG